MDLLMVVLENMRDEILDEVKNIEPVDETERLHIDDVLSWIQGPSDIFRIAKPDNPPKHLVSYFVVYDPRVQKLMLIDHVKANMWLPSGGHVEIDEHPRETVRREAMEELELVADFRVIGEEPAFTTVTETRGPGTHTDVSFWYVIVGDSTAELNYDKREMRGLKWLSFDEVLAMDDQLLDPHMKRFVRKFSRMLHE
jgi:8-oxo-dGTP pyrophosphatase MutT (NUDIX family)